MADSSAAPAPAERRRVQPDGAVLICGTNLRVRVALLKPGFVLATAHGEVADPEDMLAETAVLSELDGQLDRVGTLTVFADLRGSPRMPSASRKILAQWARRHQARLFPAHVLVQSKPIEIALSVVNMLVGGGLVKIHTRPEHFLDLVRKVAPKLSELPAVPEA